MLIHILTSLLSQPIISPNETCTTLHINRISFWYLNNRHQYGGPKVHARLAFVVCSFVVIRDLLCPFPVVRDSLCLSFVPCYSYFTFLFLVICESRFPFSILGVTFSVPCYLSSHSPPFVFPALPSRKCCLKC